MDLKNTSLEDLLASLSDPAPAETPDCVAVFMASEGYYPGQSKIMAADLTSRFKEWWGAQPPELIEQWGGFPHHNVLGQLFRKYLRVGRNKYGTFYYYSRQEEPTVPKYLAKT